ncbi:class I SAM-dependent methyltransferase [Lichenihabitans psoromatis]|uniref:class I SAM-dependent methyltransferase n=1 Tax=Lichenihabitans psoromatis TaxID=2528642 RepID=UPI001038441F|nr:class I SAM-dependent methyltransferase [Lichenihabitans psoromatis]
MPVFEIDLEFTSFEEWERWSHSNPFVFDISNARCIVEAIYEHGFIHPLTNEKIPGSAVSHDDGSIREGLFVNGMSSRSRAVLKLLDEKMASYHKHEIKIYAAEAVTAFALLLRGHFPKFVGSEYMATKAEKELLFPIEHQDIMRLTYESQVFDLVSTNEVLEHVPDIDAALRELARVLRPGGWYIGTHPFRFMDLEGDVRTVIWEGRLKHLKTPEIHGNPVRPGQGSLVFETPGWNILARAREAGFASASFRFVASARNGFVTDNSGVFVLCAQK